MKVHFSMDHLPEIPRPVVTVGSFDGVHVGHRTIVSRLNDIASVTGGSSVLITFHPHPRKVLYPDTSGKDLELITTREEKCLLLEDAGLDHLIIIEFTAAFARTTPEDFVEHSLVGKLKAHTIVVGFNHYFGYNKRGSFKSLYRLRNKFGFNVEEIPEQEIQNETVSSTKIRKALKQGSIQRANAYLEHHFRIRAFTKQSIELKKVPGCVSFDLEIRDGDKLIPPDGIYAVSFLYDQQREKGAIEISGRKIRLILPGHPFRPAGIEVSYLFHKRIADPDQSGINNALDIVRELVY